MYVFVLGYSFLYSHIHTHAHTHMHTHTHMHEHTYNISTPQTTSTELAHQHIHTCMCIPDLDSNYDAMAVRTCSQPRSFPGKPECVHCICMYATERERDGIERAKHSMHAYMHIHACKHACIRTYVRTYIHTGYPNKTSRAIAPRPQTSTFEVYLSAPMISSGCRVCVSIRAVSLDVCVCV
jgi:hypothetical protein